MLNRPEPSLVAWPSVAGCPVVASNNVTRTLGSGWLELVPPVCTTPLSDLGFADQTLSELSKTASPASSTRVIVIK
jgi:hypothetical protein